MKFTPLALLAAVSMFILTACGKDEAPESAGATGNALLAYAPTGSPYLGGNLEPTPSEVIDGFLQKWEPVTTTLQSQLGSIRTQLENAPDATDTPHRLALSLLQELDGKFNRQGLESLGFDLQAHHVVYALGGAFPVARMGLGDAAALKATVQRVLERAGVNAPEVIFAGQAYWRLDSESLTLGAGESDSPVAIYIAIREDHLALGVFPDSVAGELLPLFLGTQKPQSSDAESRLQATSGKYGHTPYFSALLDLQLLADQFLAPGTALARALGSEYAAELETFGDTCKAEFREIISHAPRLVMGVTELQPAAIGMQYVVETDSTLAQQLAALLTDVPGADMQTSRLVDFSFGINVGALRDLLREKALAIVQAPYQCAKLQDLNERATEGLAQLEQPMPPLVNNFRGLRVSLSKLSVGQATPESAEGLIAVHVEQPEMFVGMAQMFLPDLSGLNLLKGEPPIPLPPNLMPIPDLVAFAALSDTAIGISVGAGEENALKPYLESKTPNNGKFLSVSYDTATYLDFTSSLSEGWQDPGQSNAEVVVDAIAGVDQEATAREITDALRQSYKAMANRSLVSIGFTENGLVIDSRMTFK